MRALAIGMIAAVVLLLIWSFKCDTPAPPVMEEVKSARKPTSSFPATKPAAIEPQLKEISGTGPDRHSAVSPANTKRLCEAALNTPNPTERYAAFEKLMAATTDFAGLEVIRQTFEALAKSGRRFDREWGAFWHQIAHRDPMATIAMIERQGSETNWYGYAMATTMQEWSGLDPLAATRWLAANEMKMDDRQFDGATYGLIEGYANHDLKGATAYALQVVKPGDALEASITKVLASKALQQGGSAGLKAWFSSLADDTQRARLFRSVASSLGEVDLDQRRRWLESQAGQPYRDDESYRLLVRNLAKTDPQAAMDYVVHMPLSPNGGGMPGIGAATFEWLVVDRPAFTNYFKAMPAGLAKDNVLKAINNSLGTKDLPQAMRESADAFLQSIK